MKGKMLSAQGALEVICQNFGWGGEQGCRLILAGIPYTDEPTPFSLPVENTWLQGSSCRQCETSWQGKQVTCERLPKGNAYIQWVLTHWKMYKKEKFLCWTEDGLDKRSIPIRPWESPSSLTPPCVERGLVGILPACKSSPASGQKPIDEPEPRGPSPSPPAPLPSSLPLAPPATPPGSWHQAERGPWSTCLWPPCLQAVSKPSTSTHRDCQEWVSKEFVCRYLQNKWRLISICILFP